MMIKKKAIILLVALFVFSFIETAHTQSNDDALRLYNQGNEAYQTGRYQEALGYYESSLKISRFLKNDQGIFANLNNIGVVYDSLGQYEKALSYYEESIKFSKKLNLQQNISTTLNNIGLIYSILGQNKKALYYFEESLKIDKQLKNLPNIATTLNNIGLVYTSLGQYEKALFNYDEALKINMELKIPQEVALCLNNIGTVYEYLGQYEKALSNFEEAFKIEREFNEPQHIATVLNNIGTVYDSLGQYERALSNYEEALKINMELKIPQEVATSLNNIGFVYAHLGQYEKALFNYEEALKIRKELNIPQDIDNSLENIGMIYLRQKKFKEAGEAYLDVKSKEGLIETFIAIRRYEEALKLLKDMLPNWNDGVLYRIQYYTQNGLALKGSGDIKSASSELLKAVTIIEEIRQKIKGEKTGFFTGGFSGGKTRAYKGLISSLLERVLKGDNTDNTFKSYGKDLRSSAFYFSESIKARVLLEAMAESARQSQKVEIPKELREKEQSLLNQVSAIEDNWEDAYKKGETTLNNLNERKERLSSELNSLITELRQKYPRYTAVYYPKPIPPEELPLKDDEVLIEYALGDDAGYIFKVSKGKVEKVIKISKGSEELEGMVNEFMVPLLSPQGISREKFSPSTGQKLYNLLLADALKDVSPDKNIIIVPDGILGVLPFEALVIKAGKDYKDSIYVGDKYKITYSQSATVLALNRILKPTQTIKPIFALGNPIYNKDDARYTAYKQNKPVPTLLAQNEQQISYRALATRREWGKTTKDDKEGEELQFLPLPETETEVETIAKLFNVKSAPPDVLLNINANETELRKVQLKNYRYIHFATHADLPGNVQGIKEPFLLLGQVENKEKDDGFLTLTEVLDLNLDADLVVLSACLTGRGKVMEGEGVVNFARAFQHAGARSVMVSLWEVASDATVEYMKSFYQNLKTGKSKAEALRLARAEIKKKYSNPFYWAPFILHGER